MGQRWRKAYSLSIIYVVRSLLIVGLLFLPKSEMLILVFAVDLHQSVSA